MRGYELTDAQWERLEPLFPPRARTGRPEDVRFTLNGIYWILATGAPWRDLPGRYGKWQAVYSRFRLWRDGGVWDRVLEALQKEADARGNSTGACTSWTGAW